MRDLFRPNELAIKKWISPMISKTQWIVILMILSSAYALAVANANNIYIISFVTGRCLAEPNSTICNPPGRGHRYNISN
jgi:hypothetical protein